MLTRHKLSQTCWKKIQNLYYIIIKVKQGWAYFLVRGSFKKNFGPFGPLFLCILYLKFTFLHHIGFLIVQKILRETFFMQYFFSCVNWKYLFLDNYAFWNLVWKYLKMLLQYFEEKNIFLSKCLFFLFISILCAKILCLNWALLTNKCKYFQFVPMPK